MGHAWFSLLQSLWPFSQRKLDDINVSDGLVLRLSLPDQTKQFVCAIRVPETQSVVYILAAQNLSERSATDAECLIKEIRHDVVITQASPSALLEIQDEESILRNDLENTVPSSAFGVLKGCFVNRTNKDKHENLASGVVLSEIFGIGFHGHFVAGSEFQALGLQPSNLVHQRMGSLVSSNSKSLVSALNLSTSDVATPLVVFQRQGLVIVSPIPITRHPLLPNPFIFFLTDLHDIFTNLPLIRRALAHAQKMLSYVERGETVDTGLLSEIHNFRVAVEGVRIVLNSAGRIIEFAELSTEEKFDVLFAQALRSQTKKFRSIVAIVDASRLTGLRKNWNISLPQDVEDLVEQFFTEYECDEEMSTLGNMERRRLLAEKPVVAVGAGATTVLGASSLSKVVPVSTFVKLATYKVPASLKLFLAQSQKAVAFAFGKTVGLSKMIVHGFASSGAKTSSVMKAAASADKIRAVTHTMWAAFYKIMRKRRVQPVRAMPWVTFIGSVSTCTGLLMYGDGIEFAAESFPAVPSIANLGRGLQSLHQASEAVRQSHGTKIQEAVQSLVNSFKKMKFQ
ncbi:hypothetical protein NE237_002370 [Protea cynaroides]|uniref:Transmembrane protein n=1 Tax=Protea cynaroides TaxID=273540 RepID=A0A9Q0QZB4_9MAGN|nr:hypothetical protein NE237_002370 [Protea cynaroides]